MAWLGYHMMDCMRVRRQKEVLEFHDVNLCLEPFRIYSWKIKADYYLDFEVCSEGTRRKKLSTASKLQGVSAGRGLQRWHWSGSWDIADHQKGCVESLLTGLLIPTF